MVVSVWRLVNTLRMVRRCFLAYAWCHLELLGSVHPSLRIIAGAELHLLFDDIFYVAGLF